VPADEIPGPGERRRGGFVPCDDERQYLVDQLLVAHGFVGFPVAARHQHLQEIEMFLGRLAAAVDQLGDQLGQRTESKCEFQVAVLLLGHDFEGVRAELFFQTLKVAAEDRTQHDFQGQFAGIVAQIDRLAARRLLGPAGGEFVIDFADQGAELVDHAAMKGGLHHAPLAAPEIALAGHDAVAEQNLDPIHPLALGVIAVVRQQHALDVVGVVDDVVVHASAGREDAIAVAILREIAPQAGQRLIAAAKIEAFGGAGRQCYGLHRHIVT
jgi:hypothetical protein